MRICPSRGGGQDLPEEQGQQEFHFHPYACPSSPWRAQYPLSTPHLPIKSQFAFLMKQLVGLGVLVWGEGL